MNERGNKAQEVHRLLAAGRELSDEQRLLLIRLRARFEDLWARREVAQRQARPEHSQPAMLHATDR